MQTRYLESFVAVVECGSLVEAARRLNITPAGVAQRIKALETEMDLKLITRSGRTVTTTEVGAAIVDKARAVIREARDLSASVPGALTRGAVRMGSITTALLGLVPDVLASFSATYPGIDIFLEPGTSIDLYNKVVDGEIDVATIVEPYFAIPKTFSFAVMREEPFILLAPSQFGSLDPHTLLVSQPFIRYDRRQWGARLANDYLKREKVRPNERFELDSLEAIAVMVDRGLGVSIIPDWSGPWPSGIAVARLPLRHPGPRRRIGLFWRTAGVRSDIIRGILKAAL